MSKTNTVLKDEGLGRLSRLGFSRVSECLLVVPKEYRDCTHAIKKITARMLNSRAYFSLTINAKASFDKFKRPTNTWKDVIRVQVDAHDEDGKSVRITVFGAVWPWLKKKRGEQIFVFGELSEWNGYLQMDGPVLIDEENNGKIIPIYMGKVGQVSAELVSEGVTRALPLIDEAGCLLLAQLGMRESEFSEITGYKTADQLLMDIHCPPDLKTALKAVDVAKKLSALSVIRNAESNQVRNPVAKSAIPVSREFVEQLVGMLPYPLTGDQWKSIQDIVSDLRSPYPMNRLVSGDVGTGKTLTFLIPAVAAYKAGASVGIIVPSQLLVSQAARELREFFPGVEVCEIISGSKLGEGIVIGTTALLSAAAKKKKVFDFIITDEQHKFSVSQKTALISKHTNFLEATATAIPRTLAIVNFGGMDLSVLKDSPVRKQITSRVVQATEIDRLYAFVNRVFEAGRQAAIILPLVEDQEQSEDGVYLQSVDGAFQEWSMKFPDRRIGVLHGKMDSDAKERIIQAMHKKELDLLISTVVIETGVTLPSLQALIVVHPERFGVSQLHQLRGRVARKGGNGYFMMYCRNQVNDSAMERLSTLVRYSSGFDIAESDMALRGYGDVENDSDNQTGSTRLLFWGVRVHRDDIEEAAKGSSLRVMH